VSGRTRRQRIVELLGDFEVTFDELRRELGVPVAVLREDLRHIEKSARHLSGGPRTLRVTPARCPACGFELTRRRFAAPSRCPRCRNERLEPPLLSLE
jgi:predicted Zn-ribbon and HTH transcriptional regulator